ncbi:hypothetical protein TRIATDRAFT_289101 [Trichoderma atroviride IMI 206040]|uniref:C2H2-type domain-containing protein n=1 Tax=Hypocrea atroviridis (strain ATCC 20476 / IMI 206040) TaxID=452589 RepID=G9NGB9_HYPAI|nr:uncharacterized protein TRIATDRAFT_289101 [Trichoderma atroviride IMI 206040]EHK50331.1 hypothetical protein TRIATDRAFT_289101 [Trichoderma atroviride IMI 206040]
MPSLGQELPKITIADCASRCIESFKACLHEAAFVHARELSLLDNQLARFSLWTANVKALDSGRGCLDFRLRDAFDVQDAIVGVVETLNYRILSCMSTLSPVTSNRVLPAINERFDSALQEIVEQITILHKFSNAIRRASRESQNLKAATTFKIEDDVGNDLEPCLKSVFAHYIRDRFPEVSDAIQERLVNTMVLRRKRVFYRRSRYGQSPAKVAERPILAGPTRPSIQINALAADQHHDESPSTNILPPRTIVQSVTQTATTFSPSNFQRASTPSVVSALRSIVISDYGNALPFPPAPCGNIMRNSSKDRLLQNHDEHISQEYKETLEADWNDILKEAGEINCPFCFLSLPARDVVDEKKWKLHVKSDLDPYVCLFEDCDSPGELYSHNSTWLKHMRSHNLRWRCISKSHSNFQCNTKGEYINHIKVCHPDKFTDEQLDILAIKNARTASPMFKSCPLCNSEDVTGKMEDHIVGHLLLLALKSLPSYEEPTEEQTWSEGEQCELSSSSARTRSTIEQMSECSSSWGGFRNYVSQFADGTTLPRQTHDSSSPAIPHFAPPPEITDTPNHYDPSIEFIEYRLFDNIDKAHYRVYEWGFLPNIHQTYMDPDDPIISAFALRQPNMRKTMAMIDPDCAICHSPAPLECDCEAKLLEFAIKHSEEKIMARIYRDIRMWATGHAQDLILEHFKEYLEQPLNPENSLQEQEQKVELEEIPKHHEQDHQEQDHPKQDHQEQGHQEQGHEKKRDKKVRTQGYQEKDCISPERPEQAQKPSQRDINEAWQAAFQGYPEALEYYFSTVELTLPADDEVAIRDPPSLRGKNSGQESRKISQD